MNPDLTTLPPLLIPRPARLSFTPSPTHPSTPSSTAPSISPDPSLPHADAYSLTITPSTIRITHRSPIGLDYARASLAQLRTQYGRSLPALDILDYPAIETRGVMLDVSRGRIPTMDEFHRLIPELAALKINHLQLYTEHTFAYAGHEEVWQGWNPITPAELLEIQTLCAAHSIELAANQNCFGHLTHWLKHPRYAPLAETHGEWTFDRFTRTGPFSLCPSDPGSIALIADLLDQLLPLFPNRGAGFPARGGMGFPARDSLVNLGCDETHDLGQGRSRDEVARRGKASVYFDFLDRVFDLARAHGFRPAFWADIALSHPDAISRIPDDAIALAWGYEAETDFDRWCELLTAAGKTAWVCPGTSSWRSITGRTTTRRANLLAAAEAAAKYGLDGYLVTDWGDAGHQQVWPIALTAIAEAADHAWNAGRVPIGSPAEPDSRAISLHCFQDHTLSVAGWLDELGDIDLPLRSRAGRAWFEGKGQPLENASVHFADLAEPWESEAIALTAADFQPLLDRLHSLRTSLPPTQSGRGLSSPRVTPSLLHDELTHTLDRTELALCRAIARRSSPTYPTPAQLLPLAEHIRDTARRLWLIRSRPGLGLADSIACDQHIIDKLMAHSQAS